MSHKKNVKWNIFPAACFKIKIFLEIDTLIAIVTAASV